MRWLNPFKKGDGLAGNVLRDALFTAAQTGDPRRLEELCRANSSRIASEFQLWLKCPSEVRDDPRAIARYQTGLIAVAAWFARNDTPQLLEALQGQGRNNPIPNWDARFREADSAKADGRFAEAIIILESLAADMSRCQGRAVERYLPMVYGSSGESFSRSEHMDRAYQAIRKALDGCLRSADLEGVTTYSGNLVEICRKLGRADEARYWLIATTNAMIQTGQAEHAIELRREHGIEPAIGLILVQNQEYEWSSKRAAKRQKGINRHSGFTLGAFVTRTHAHSYNKLGEH